MGKDKDNRKPGGLALAGWGLKTAALGIKNLLVKRTEEPVPAVRADSLENTEPVVIRQGMLVGVYNSKKTVEVYAGIPYAKPPVGELRWKEPQPPSAWEGILRADHFGPMSMQRQVSPVMNSIYEMKVLNRTAVDLKKKTKEPCSEDSLYLNIWKPAGRQADLPVLLFIHGGSFETGQTWWEDYNGESLAAKGIVVVNFAYRLGIFGYLALPELAAESPNHTTGNYGLLDQIQALKWVWKNISAFGGDPDNITIAGESSGAAAVGALCVSPLAKGLFRRAIAESGGITPRVPYHSFRSYRQATEAGKKVLEKLSVSSLDHLREIDASKLLSLKIPNNAMTVDGYAITKQPYLSYLAGENNEEAVLGGFNQKEADLFTMLMKKPTAATYRERLSIAAGDHAAEVELFYPARDDQSAISQYNKVLGGTWFAYSHHLWASYLDAQGRSAYLYYFTKDNGRLGANHTGELVYAYGNLRYHAPSYDASDRKLSALMKEYWVNFVKWGNPNGEGLPEWKSFAAAPGEVMNLDRKCAMVKDLYIPLYEVLGRYQAELEAKLAAEEEEAAAREAQEAAARAAQKSMEAAQPEKKTAGPDPETAAEGVNPAGDREEDEPVWNPAEEDTSEEVPEVGELDMDELIDDEMISDEESGDEEDDDEESGDEPSAAGGSDSPADEQASEDTLKHS